MPYRMSLEVNVKGDEIEYFCENTNDDDDVGFNTTIGCIEDMLMNDEFLKMQTMFLDKYWKYFEDNDENKLIYMEIFEEYQTNIEKYIENYLKENIVGFCMDVFIEELLIRKDELDGEIFDILFTLSDFLTFKEMFLDYKAMKEGKTIDLSTNISITQFSSLQNAD